MTFHAEPFAQTADSSAAIHDLASGQQAGAEPSRLSGAPLHDQVLGCPTRRRLGLPQRLPGGMRAPKAAFRPFGSLAVENP